MFVSVAFTRACHHLIEESRISSGIVFIAAVDIAWTGTPLTGLVYHPIFYSVARSDPLTGLGTVCKLLLGGIKTYQHNLGV